LGSTETFSVILGDIDSDGDLDLVAGNDGTSTVSRNDGAGNFTDSGQTLGSARTSAVTLGDVDADGDLDLVAGNAGQIKVYTNLNN